MAKKGCVTGLGLSAATGVELRVKADGRFPRRYKFVLRDDTTFNGVCYTASFTIGMNQGSLKNLVFESDGEAVRIPFDSLVPTIFAKTVPGAKINLRNICSVQLALSKFEYDGGLNGLFQEGSFELDLLDVRTY